jgi:uncharacterized protein YfaS (alpha-2-macroglobulin family)
MLCAGDSHLRGEVPALERPALEALVREGNFKDAYEGYRGLVLDPKDDPRRAGEDLEAAIECLEKLHRIDEIDVLRDQAIELHRANWRLLTAAAVSLTHGHGQGVLRGGRFVREEPRFEEAFVSSWDRDRVRALQLLGSCLDAVGREADRAGAGEFYLKLAEALLDGRDRNQAWKLQLLTDLSSLPDYDSRTGPFFGGGSPGAPVEADGTPVYYQVPRRFAEARNDGERWRWALSQAIEVDPRRAEEAHWIRARFLLWQFGVQAVVGASADPLADPLGLGTLRDEETVARLATGVRRFTLPDDQNPILLLRRIADESATQYGEVALENLAGIYGQRLQLDHAAQAWADLLRRYGEQAEHRAALTQILDNLGQFEPSSVLPAGREATLMFRFRNGNHVDFQAFEINVPAVIDDLKTYLKASPHKLDEHRIQIGNIGYRLVEDDEGKYLGPEVARWGVDLQPRPGHLDARVKVTTPLRKPGAYLVRGQMTNGNVSRIVVWLDDTVIVKKPLDGKTYLFVADATTGQPVPNASLELFAYRQVQIGNTKRWRVDTRDVSAKTDAEGQAIVQLDDPDRDYQWLVLARAAGGRRAHLGFTEVWTGFRRDPEFDQDKVFTITDRPVYRPGQTVKFKLWVRHARYDQDNVSDFAGQEFPLEILDPKGEKVLAKSFRADAYGGFDGSFELPSGATLGDYSIDIPERGGGWFRVEEYKKPEFEVRVDAPTKPVKLGERVEATIRANYFFGAPVVQAKVKYKVLRSPVDERWYPVGPWDWYYGAGYGWFGVDHPWYPGWSRWGSPRPLPAWSWQGRQPPEIVAEAELPIGPDGTVRVPIDTSLAKTEHGDQNHLYEIEAEVVDASRRTIVGTGRVLVARRPFFVSTWVDRGHSKVGDTLHASLAALTLDRRAVHGKGTLRLLRVHYDAQAQPVETALQEWPLETNAQGQAEQAIKATEAGQYRLSATIGDADGHEVEGGYLLTVRGEGFDGHELRFNDLELVPDRRAYQPGDTVRLMINVNSADGTVLLFERPVDGIYLPPKVLRLRGKSTVDTMEIVKKDMPNVFVEALTIADGEIHEEVREVVVPPESRVLDVAVKPLQTTLKPGQKTRVRLELKDTAGKPFVGSTALAVYDKAVESIAGRSNVPEIKAFFWQWRRSHFRQRMSNLDLVSHNLIGSTETAMEPVAGVPDLSSGMAGMGGGYPGMADFGRFEVAANAAPMARVETVGGGEREQLHDFREPAEKWADPGTAPVEPTIRKNFADTAYWAGAITTGDDGTAEVDVAMPESLTTWKVKVWGMGHGTRVGHGEAEVVTTKDLLVRLQAPRFFTQKDEVVLSANVHNKLKTKKSVQANLELEGGVLVPLTETSQTVDIAADGEARVDWRVKVVKEGEALVRMKALTDEESDAMEMRFPAYVHGMLKTESWAGAIRPGGESASLTVRVPNERRPEQTRLEVRYSPTLAGALVDAVPYLADYPYGCTEQTVNRFVPAVIAQNVLLEMGLDLKAIRDKRTNLNARQLGDAAARGKEWKRLERNPVFDEAELSDIVKAGLHRLADMQLSDGGWGWFSGFGEQSWPHTTAVVVHGLQLAKRNDIALPKQVLEQGVAWLGHYQDQQVGMLKNFATRTRPFKEQADDLDAFVFLVLTEAAVRGSPMLEYLDRDRTHLSVSGKALFGLALEQFGEKEKLVKVLTNIAQYVVQDEENQTAYLKLPNEGFWWYWYGNTTETEATYLRLLARTDPKGETTARLAKYLVNNRGHGSYWNSTRDTASCVEALHEFLRASGEDRPDMTVTIAVDGKVEQKVHIAPGDLFGFDNAVVLEGEALTSGEHTITFQKEGRGPLYFNAYLTNFTLEDPISRTGLEVKVDRKVVRLVPQDKTAAVAGARGQAIAQKVEAYRREELADGATLKSGDLVEVELVIESKNDYEYVIFEDRKAAGFEPVEVRSGYTSNGLGAYMELRDERVAFFVRSLPRGLHSVSYRLRAEVPGRFSALPARAYGMYAPELVGNSDEIKLGVED